jgi:outer membrane lipoprotein-sorting protein
MTKSLAIVVIFLALAAPSVHAAGSQADIPACPTDNERPDAAALIKRIDQLLTGRSTVGVMTMSIKTPSWSRSLKLKIWSQGKDYALIRVLEGGPRETGMLTLKREKQLWNWLPQAGRVMKLPSGMLGDSWMGSDFTNDDLLRGNSLTDDFKVTISGVEKVEGRNAWHVVLDPKPTAVVVWGRIEMLVDRASCLPIAELFFDEDGSLARQMSFSDFRQIGWRLFPATMTVVPADKGRATSIVYSEIQFDIDIPADTFSLQRLRQGR